jgi:hypothetical protein
VKCIREKEFLSVIERGSGRALGDVRFENCLFDFCAVSETTDVNLRTTVRNVEVIDCTVQNNTSIGPAIIENVLVEGLTTVGLLILWDPLLKHVVLRGDVGQIKINSVVHPDVLMKPETQIPFDEAKEAYYADVDWALDIRHARFKEFDLSGVPARLVRRDSDTQVVVLRSDALKQGWRQQLSPDNYWLSVIDVWLGEEHPSLILAAPKALPGRTYRKARQDLDALRNAGVAQPD